MAAAASIQQFHRYMAEKKMNQNRAFRPKALKGYQEKNRLRPNSDLHGFDWMTLEAFSAKESSRYFSCKNSQVGYGGREGR